MEEFWISSNDSSPTTVFIIGGGIDFWSSEISIGLFSSKFGWELSTLSRSLLIILPLSPDPWMVDKSMFFSKAIFLASGDAIILLSESIGTDSTCSEDWASSITGSTFSLAESSLVSVSVPSA